MRRILIGALTLTYTGWVAAKPQQAVWVGEPSQKVVFNYGTRTVVDGEEVDVVAVAPHQVVVMGLTPLDKQPALSPHDFMICHAQGYPMQLRRSVDGTDAGQFREIMFTCGGKRYMFTKLDIEPDKVEVGRK